MSTTFPRGFRAAGVTAGLKPSGKPDLALVVNDGPARTAAAVYTSNRCRAHPVIWSEQASADGRVAAVVLNSGGANCFTGPAGMTTVERTAEAVADGLNVAPGDVVVCSTGLIGVWEQQWEDALLGGIPPLLDSLAAAGGQAAAEAIMTTDTVPKTAQLELDGYRIGGMAKGAGMLAPGLATMLVVLTTDADLGADAGATDAALRHATARTFDRLDTDGCMSTNDTVVLMASGASGVTPELEAFAAAVEQVCADLAAQLHADAEGAKHDIVITTRGAASEEEAVTVSRAIARSALFKTAIFGEDPNWGRVLAQIGTTDATFSPDAIDIAINGVQLCRGGVPDEPPELVRFGRRVEVLVNLHAGEGEGTVLTSDLTHDYVEENSVYST